MHELLERDGSQHHNRDGYGPFEDPPRMIDEVSHVRVPFFDLLPANPN
jgi:hypothetical protein